MTSLFRVDKKSNHRVKNSRPTPIRIVQASAAGTVLTLTFDQPVSWMRELVPQYTTDVVGANPESAQLTTPTTLELTFSASIAAATVVTIPFEEPAIRNAVGGFVADSTFPV